MRGHSPKDTVQRVKKGDPQEGSVNNNGQPIGEQARDVGKWGSMGASERGWARAPKGGACRDMSRMSVLLSHHHEDGMPAGVEVV